MARIITHGGGDRVIVDDGSTPEPDKRNEDIRTAYAELGLRKKKRNFLIIGTIALVLVGVFIVVCIAT